MRTTIGLATILLSASAATSAHALEPPAFEIDYVQLLIQNDVQLNVGANASGSTGPLDGIHWKVDFDASAILNEWPTISCNGGGCAPILPLVASGFELEVSIPVEVRVDSDASVSANWYPFPLRANVDLYKTVGVRLHLPFGPGGERREGSVTFEDLGGNVDVDGLERAAIPLGTFAGGFVLGVGFGVGAGLGAIAGEAAEPHVERAIADAFARALDAAGTSATRELNRFANRVEVEVKRAALVEGPPLRFSNAGPIEGMDCVQLDEAADAEGTWSDNYLCSSVGLGMAWSMAGPIGGMNCTQIYDHAEPDYTTWLDNYLCLPDDRFLDLAWSEAGPVDGYECVSFDEPSDPHTWGDNYLCHRRPILKDGPRR
jgi:hypothetical protein